MKTEETHEPHTLWRHGSKVVADSENAVTQNSDTVNEDNSRTTRCAGQIFEVLVVN